MIATTATIVAAWLPLDVIKIDHTEHGTPMRHDFVRMLAKRLRDEPDQTTDPIITERRADGYFWITNGRHRFWGHRLAQRPTIAAFIVDTVPQ